MTNNKAFFTTFVSIVFVFALFYVFTKPNTAYSFIRKEVFANEESKNSQTLSILKPEITLDPKSTGGPIEPVIVNESLLSAESDYFLNSSDISIADKDSISIYVVREGDTISGIAEMFGISSNTIRWANEISGNNIKPGQILVVLPINGVKYKVQKGDTIQTIAKKYGGDINEIARFNGLDDNKITVGNELIIPNGEIPRQIAASSTSKSSTPKNTSTVSSSYYMRPIPAGVGRTSQGIHGKNAVDLAAPIGTKIIASASGRVIVSNFREGNPWFGGYGNHIIISHPNGTQTLYGHNSKNLVSVGETVEKGQVIGLVGSTGRSTGPHVHFEIRGGPRNPFTR